MQRKFLDGGTARPAISETQRRQWWRQALGVGALLIATVMLVGGVSGCGDKRPKYPACGSDKDCKDGQVCFNKKCVACIKDDDCASGNSCIENACVAKPECTADDQCGDGKVCQAGKCQACSSDGDCGPGGKCQAGACQRATKCSTDEQCADDEDCVNGYCAKAVSSAPQDVSCPLATIYFGFDDATVAASERDRLDANASCLDKNRTRNLYLIGHTDSSGTDEYNIALSERRALTVSDYLTRLGVTKSRLQVVPKGEGELTGQGDDKDRRVEFQWR